MTERSTMTGVIEWRPVVGFPGYMVSDRGTVMSYRISPTGRIMKLTIDWKGYRLARLTAPHLPKTPQNCRSFIISRLVLATFAGPRPAGQECRHLDGDNSNNRLENLAWGTSQENSDDIDRHGHRRVGVEHSCAKLTDGQARAIYRSNLSTPELAFRFNISRSSVGQIRRGVTWNQATGAPKVIRKSRWRAA